MRMVELQLGFNPIDTIISTVAGSMEFLVEKVSRNVERSGRNGV